LPDRERVSQAPRSGGKERNTDTGSFLAGKSRPEGGIFQLFDEHSLQKRFNGRFKRDLDKQLYERCSLQKPKMRLKQKGPSPPEPDSRRTLI